MGVEELLDPGPFVALFGRIGVVEALGVPACSAEVAMEGVSVGEVLDVGRSDPVRGVGAVPRRGGGGGRMRVKLRECKVASAA